MFKKIFIFSIFSLFSFWSVFAVDDCHIVEFDLNEDSYNYWLGNLYPDAAIYQAMLNLKAYCCYSNLIYDKGTCDKDKSKFQEIYPQSPYLYDHLLDVSLRRLDVVGNIYDLSISDLDDKAVEWRSYIVDDVAENANWNFAMWVENKFSEFWADNPDYQKKFEQYNSAVYYSLDNLIDISLLYSDASLYQRYEEMCWLNVSLYYILMSTFNKDSDLRLESDWFIRCRNYIVPKILNDEMIYVKAVVMKKSMQLLHSSINSYIYDYYGKNRLMHLQQNVMKLTDLFQTMAKNLSEWTNQCN